MYYDSIIGNRMWVAVSFRGRTFCWNEAIAIPQDGGYKSKCGKSLSVNVNI